jgi:hypothetical protein
MRYMNLLTRSFRAKATGMVLGVASMAAAPFGLEVDNKRTHAHDWSDLASYIPFEPTLQAARQVGVSVGDYIDSVMNGTPNATQATIDQMAALGVFAAPIETVVEIGPGSGRYLEKTLKACPSARYEIYETAQKWATYVAEKYGAIWQPTDGRSLAATPTGSVDLVQAHKVFSSIPFLATARYWLEIFRVTRPGAFAVFDIVTEACMTPELVTRWVSSGRGSASYPALTPRAVAIDTFASNGFGLVGSFIVPMGPGTTETFVFRKAPLGA